jgi:hypothetical protein
MYILLNTINFSLNLYHFYNVAIQKDFKQISVYNYDCYCNIFEL